MKRISKQQLNKTGSWDNFYQNAESWFNTMGYSTEAMIYPNKEKVKSHIQSNETAVFLTLYQKTY